jgi:hypothetical protein
MTEIFGYDFDGVISIGINPSSKDDYIITGRCIDETEEVLTILKSRGITNKVFFNPLTLAQRGNHTVASRTSGANHKANTIASLKKEGINVVRFFEDDELQRDIIQAAHPEIKIVHIVSDLVQK